MKQANADHFIINQEWVTPEIRAVQAGPEDVAAAQGLLFRTAQWLQSIGSKQWNQLLTGEDRHHIDEAVLRGDVFLFKKEERLAAIVILQQHASEWDRNLWGEDGHDTSVYLHRLAIDREFGGTGLGSAILHWALTGIRFQGKDRIRLDCIADNPGLNRLYSGAGFTLKGQHESGFNIYEKIVR